jgi:hypothetical protein
MSGSAAGACHRATRQHRARTVGRWWVRASSHSSTRLQGGRAHIMGMAFETHLRLSLRAVHGLRPKPERMTQPAGLASVATRLVSTGTWKPAAGPSEQATIAPATSPAILQCIAQQPGGSAWVKQGQTLFRVSTRDTVGASGVHRNICNTRGGGEGLNMGESTKVDTKDPKSAHRCAA